LQKAPVVVGALQIIIIPLVETVFVGEGRAGGICVSDEALTLLLGVLLGMMIVFFIFRKPPKIRRRRKGKAKEVGTPEMKLACQVLEQ
jgi:hypothetical protein